MITILMATYNGETFIVEQIESILKQTNNNFVLYINDDNSTDNTLKILIDYSLRYPDTVFVSNNDINSGSAKHNFLNLMISHKDDYVMLCDQDDVWLSDKIELSLKKIKQMESEFGKSTPLLVHSDLRVVNEKLDTISPSFKAAMNANYDRTRLKDQLIQNTLTGCTAIYNRALSDKIIAQPEYMIMHDWWLMLVASAFGKIGHIDAQTVLYRQHGKNEIGAKDVRTLKYKVKKLLNYKGIKQAISETYMQAQSLLDIYQNDLTEPQIELISTYCRIPHMSKFKRWQTICHLGVLKNGIARKIANFIFI